MSSETAKVRNPALWVPTLYVAMGMPFAVTMYMSVNMYHSLGLSDTRTAAITSLVGLPWSLKPFWAGFMEMYRTKKFFVVSAQFLGAVLFGLLGLSLSS